jgi:hypothetical protein
MLSARMQLGSRGSTRSTEQDRTHLCGVCIAGVGLQVLLQGLQLLPVLLDAGQQLLHSLLVQRALI